MVLNLRYFTEVDSFADLLRHSGQCPQNIVSRLAKSDPRSSRTVSLRQLSFLFSYRAVLVIFAFDRKCLSLIHW